MEKIFGQLGVVDRVRKLWKQLTPRGLQPGPLSSTTSRATVSRRTTTTSATIPVSLAGKYSGAIGIVLVVTLVAGIPPYVLRLPVALLILAS